MAFPREESELVEAYNDCGFEVPLNMNFDVLQRMIHEAVTPSEVPAVSHDGVNWSDVEAMRRETIPAIAQMFESESPSERERATKLAFALGRLNGRFFAEALKDESFRPLIMFTPLGFELPNGSRIRGELQGSYVVEYGMGMHGTMNHLLSLHKGTYSLTAMAKNNAEIAAINGLLDYFELAPEQLRQLAGIPEGVQTLIDEGYTGRIDLIVALRASMAGHSLAKGVSEAHILLKDGGTLVAMGARDEPDGISYDQLAGLLTLQSQRGLYEILGDITIDYPKDDNIFGGPTRLTVAHRTAEPARAH